jgi:HD-GYP domain-containing protein (c-di-GMP phosphodiesterase class II)
MKTHTLIGEAMLGQIGGLLGEVGQIVRSCHERWDGAGYPDRLAGEAIPLEARIVCACDAWSAMTTNRSYRRARTQEAAASRAACVRRHAFRSARRRRTAQRARRLTRSGVGYEL